MLNARNDPFLPADYLPNEEEVSSSVTLEFPAHGGHVGFVSARTVDEQDWLPQRLLYFFNENPD